MSNSSGPAQKRSAVVSSTGAPAPATNTTTDRTKAIVNDFNGVVTKEAGSTKVTIKYKHSLSPPNKLAESIPRLTSTLENDSAAAALVKSITYYGDVNMHSSNGDALMSHCANIEEIKSLTCNADWRKVLAGKTHLKHLNLFTAGDFYDLKLPTLLNTLKDCKELVEIRILGDSMRTHTVQESIAAYGSFNASTTLTLPKVHTLTVTPFQASCNPVDLHFLLKLCPNVKKLRIRVDSTIQGCAAALDDCFGAGWSGITDLELKTPAVMKSQVAINLNKLTRLQFIQTHSYLISPTSLPNVASLTSIEYEVVEDIEEVMKDLKIYLTQATNAKLNALSLVTRQLEKKDTFSKELKAIPNRQSLIVSWPNEGVARPGSTKKRSIYDRADYAF